jgi:uncharacterized protein YjbI with pentapeptide repeats
LAKVDFASVDFASVDFASVDFASVDLASVDFASVDFASVDFTARIARAALRFFAAVKVVASGVTVLMLRVEGLAATLDLLTMDFLRIAILENL